MRSRLLLAVICCAVLAAPPAAAQLQLPDDNCSVVCTWSTPCNQWCVDRERDPWVLMTCEQYGICGGASVVAAEPAPAGDLDLAPPASPAAAPAMTPAESAAASWPECTYDHECEWACPQGGRCDAGGCLCSDALQ